LHEVRLDTAQQITRDLKLSTAEATHVMSLVKSLPRFGELQDLSVSELKRFLRMPRFEDHMELARISATAARRDLDAWKFATTMLRKWSSDDIAPALLISGDDLIDLGLSPGPLFREILTRVEDEQLEGRLQTREHALSFVRENYGL